MKNPAVAFFLSFMVVVGLLVLISRRSNTGPEAPASAPIDSSLEQKHLVTGEMIRDAEELTGRAAPAVSAAAVDGTVFSLDDLVKEKPAAIIFIKDKCPCSAAAEPYFQELYRRYQDGIAFYGVIDGHKEVAQAWIDLHHTPYPILLDAGLDVVHDYHIPNSAYLVLIGKDKVIRKVYPGYSVDLLNDMNAAMAKLAGTQPKPLDLPDDTPVEPYSGCTFD